MKSLIKSEQVYGIKTIAYRWLYKKKNGIPGVEKPRYKLRLEAKRFTQRLGIDCTEVFYPVVKYTSIMTLLSIIVKADIELE